MEFVIVAVIVLVIIAALSFLPDILRFRKAINETIEDVLQQIDEMEGVEFEGWVTAFHTSFLGFKAINLQSSQDYGIDVIVEKDGIKTAIQCKRYKGTVGVDAVREAFAGADYYDCQGAAVWTNSTFTRQAKELAKKIGVTLVDREVLALYILKAMKQ